MRQAAGRAKRRRARLRGMKLISLLTILCAALVTFVEFRSHHALWLDRATMRAERTLRPLIWGLGLQQPGAPDLTRLEARLAAVGVKQGDPIFIRVFKKESELEVWMRRGDRFVLATTYPICRWSGRLGPKYREGDRQSPEGLYTVTRHQLNPNSRWHRSFNIGYPNHFDRALSRTGSFIMVHGGCSSVGCFAITNDMVDELWRTVVAALGGGQKRFQIQVFPFRMTADNLTRYRASPHLAFWRDLKPAYDLFERDRVVPKVTVCNKRYQIAPGMAASIDAEPIAKDCPPDVAETPAPTQS